MNTPIAIVGMGCRFAGAADLDAYWKLTLEGRNGFGPVPADRWSHEQFFDANPRATDKSYAPNGGFIEDIRSFPALVLGIPPRRVEVMDPQQRFSLEVALAAIQDAGYRPSELPRRTGVYVGVTAAEWRVLVASRVIAQFMASGTLGEAPTDIEAIEKAVANVVPSRPFTAPGVLSNMIAAAVAQELDLHGPAYSVDAACASAMMAVADGVAALQAGAIDCAVAGGVYLAITPEHHVAFSRIGAISKSGLCLPFDAKADGFVQGDGAGALVLKRLDDAQRDGDRIYAVIRSVATNNDGRGDGPMAPVMAGQIEVIREAWSKAGVSASDVGYVEAHGTGTLVGDATEFEGLMAALGGEARRAALGSSKANVGHTMAAAAIAGLIRTALAIHHGVIPPMSGFQAAKDDLGLEGSPFRVPTAPEPWEGRRVGGVSSFGFGGTNGHAVLDAAPPPPARPAPQPELLLLSAGDVPALKAECARLADALSARPEATTLAGVARALAARTRLPARLGLVVDSLDAAVAQLRAFAEGREHDGRTGTAPHDEPKVAFLYPGQGAQRVGMLCDAAARFPVVAGALAEVEAELADLLPRPLTHLLWPERRPDAVDPAVAEAELTDTAHCQPVMFACSVALGRLLASVGVKPAVATGHSLGEFNAAVDAGVLSARDAARFVAARGRAMADVAGDPGAMSALNTDRAAATGFLVDGAVIANVNHPRQVVVSGRTDAVAEVGRRAAAAGVGVTPLVVSHAFHSPIFDALDARPWLAGVALSDPRLPVASGIAERPYTSAADARSVFERHARSPVDFVGALAQCRDAGATVFLQVGAGGPLASFARGTLAGSGAVVGSLGGRDDADGGRSLLEGLSWLWANGVDVDVRPVTAPAPVATLPAEVLPREPYWAVKDTAQKGLEIRAVDGARKAPARPAAPEPAPAAPPADDVLGKVLAVVAKVSAYPVDALKPSMKLVDDLGFDSLMVGDMASGLAAAFPALGGIPQELLINGPTVQDLVDFARTGAAAPDTSVDHTPLTAYAPVWVEGALLGRQPRDLRDRVALLAGSDKRRDAVRSAFGALGLSVVDDPSEPADLIVWESDGDGSGALIALLAAQLDRGATPDLLVVRDPGDARSEADAGVARAWAAERDALGRSVTLDGAPAARLVDEWLDADRSTDARWTGDLRQIPGFAPAPSLDPLELGPADTALITGGTSGIGLLMAKRLAASGVALVLVSRSGGAVPEGLDPARTRVLPVDVTDRDALVAALEGQRITLVIHAAGLLADGPLESVDPAAGARARAVKLAGWDSALSAAPHARAALAIGSWAGRFGSRHQAHYAAANAGLAGQAGPRRVVAEFGPWTNTAMVRTIPAPIQAAMRAEGVDFVGDEAGVDALMDDLRTGAGVRTHGRDLPPVFRIARRTEVLSVQTHPYLADHAIEGTPVLPLAAAADLLAQASGLKPPFELRDLTLYQGVTVKEPVRIEVRLRADRAELRVGERSALAYRARVRPVDPSTVTPPPATRGGDAPITPLSTFYGGLTFHGPLLQGITAIQAVAPGFVRGRVRTGRPSAWIPGTDRAAFAVDPLALDSAMQLSGYVAVTRFQRAGTPVGVRRLVQLAPLPDGELTAEVRFDPAESADDNRFEGTIALRDASGALLLLAEGAVAELRRLDTGDDPLKGFEIKREWVDPSTWQAVKDLDMRLQMAQLSGIRNPYFSVHEGTAKNTTVVGGRTLINFSSYNYLGLSGDPRVVADVQAAVAKFGTSVSASRVASGERPFHGRLEKLLAAAQDVEDTLVFTAGHATNVTTIGHLMGKADLVLHDELIHDSALQGIKLAGCARRGFKHDDPADLESQLKELRAHYQKVLIVVEGVYSMDGDICDLPAYIALKKKYGCMLMCDEAHSFGVIGATGQGCREHFGIAGSEVDIWMGTLSKSVASCGGWIGGKAPLIRYLRYTAPGFVYSAGLTPANGVAAVRSLELMLEEPWRVQKLQHNAQLFHDELVKRGVDTGPAKGGSAVVPAVTGNSLHALLLSQRLNDQGVNVQPIVYPAVADNAARLRFFLSSTHTDEELVHTAELVASTLAGIRKEFPA